VSARKGKSRLGDVLGFLILSGVLLGIVGGTFAYERALWKECRATNSFWYCSRVLSK
jgi:hypothetical protein